MRMMREQERAMMCVRVMNDREMIGRERERERERESASMEGVE